MAMQVVERPTETGGTIQVTAAPFNSFTQIADFQLAVSRLVGVTSARIRSAQRDVLVLDVEYTGLVPLHVRLRDLRDVRWTPVQVTEDAVEIAVA